MALDKLNLRAIIIDMAKEKTLRGIPAVQETADRYSQILGVKISLDDMLGAIRKAHRRDKRCSPEFTLNYVRSRSL